MFGPLRQFALLVNIKIGIRFGGVSVGMIVISGIGTKAVTVIARGIETVKDGMQKRRTGEGGPWPTTLIGGDAATCQ